MSAIEGREFRYRPGGPVDLALTVGPLAHGHGDPAVRVGRAEVRRATRTPEGPGSVLLRASGDAVTVRAWGPGAEWLIAKIPAFLGEWDDPSAFQPRHRLLRELARRLPGLRFSRADVVFEPLLPTVLEQKITGIAARRSYRAIVRRYGEDAPGPLGLRLPPTPRTLARLPYECFHPLGVERRRADILRRAAAVAPRLEEARGMSGEAADRRLRAIRGIGPWTSAEIRRTALGDTDAVSIGDYHLPSVVAWALAGEPRADDARMLELLEPYRGQRGRVQRLLEASAVRPPAFGPRMEVRWIAGD